MATFVCINDLSDHSEELIIPKKFMAKRLPGKEISGLFFYSNSVNELSDKTQSNQWLEFALLKNISVYACRTSLTTRNISLDLNPKIKIVGLGQLIEGVLCNEKTLVIGKL
tara:strand:+ start:45 stop:377 length:333 start_codon:yes stop_codon:yes gene_type:complete